MPTTDTDVQKMLAKVKKLELGEKLDLSSDEDLSIGIMNLISIEEHLFFTANKTGKSQYYDILKEVRDMRKDLLKRIVKDYEGEVWCISKHLLSSSMRLMEVGTKMLGKGDNQAAQDFFTKAYHLYSLFWGLNMGLIKDAPLMTSPAKSTKPDSITFVADKPIVPATQSVGLFSKLGEVVKKAIDCCRE